MSGSRTTPQDILSSEYSQVRSKVKLGHDKLEGTHRGPHPEIEQRNEKSTLEHRNRLWIQTPSIDDEIHFKYEGNCFEHISTSQTEDDPDLDAKINPSPIINSGLTELNELYLNLLQCDMNCETCQKYVRKLSEHVKAVHISGQLTRDPLHVDSLEVDMAPLVEVKCETVVIERVDCSEGCDLHFETDVEGGSGRDPDPDYNASPSLTLNSKSSQKLTSGKEKRFNCEDCGQSFERNSALTIHLRCHSGEKPYNCDECTKCFSTRSKLTIHMRSHTLEKPYNCEVCGNGFTTSSHLTVHSRTHTGDRPYKCEECEKGFGTKKDLTIHIRSHTGEKPYNCEQCVKSFSTRSYLKIHLRSHTQEKPYNCGVCEKSFASNTHLTVHSRIHTGDRPYKCEQCVKCFTTKRDLTIHIRSHTGEKPYECEQCGLCFSTKSYLTVHLKRAHQS